MDTIKIAVTGEAQTHLPASRANLRVSVICINNDKTLAKQKAEALTKDLKGYITGFRDAATTADDDDVDETDADDEDSEDDATKTSNDDYEYEVVHPTTEEKVAADPKESDAVVLTEAPGDHLDSASSKAVAYISSSVEVRHVRRESIACGFPHSAVERSVNRASSDNQSSDQKDASPKTKLYEAAAFFTVYLGAHDQLLAFERGVRNINEDCRIDSVEYLLCTEQSKKNDSLLRRSAMKDAMQHVRDYCDGMDCKPTTTTITPISISAKFEMPDDPIYCAYPNYGNPHRSVTEDALSAGTLQHISCYRPLPQTTTSYKFERKLKLKVEFEIRTNKIYLDKHFVSQEKHKQPKKKPLNPGSADFFDIPIPPAPTQAASYPFGDLSLDELLRDMP